MSPIPAALTAALADRYRLERELGAGGMATVYLAQDLKHERHVAIKVLKPELAAVLGAERFVQEIKTTAQLSHPHILPLFDSGEAAGFLYYVMPYIQGETIREKLNRETQLGIEEAVRITTEVADALDYAHRHGVIHRDIKPENILLHDGRAMVMDFGIALAVSAAAGGRMTETGLSLGTPHYMSPEQATADRTITARSDVYSLGAVLYEMLAGEPPHMGNSAQQIIMKIIAERAQPVTELRSTVPANVAAALARALERLPADRFETARAFADALANPAFTIAADGAAASTANPPYRSTALIAVPTALAVLLGGLAAWGWLRPLPKPVVRYPLAFPAGAELSGPGHGRQPYRQFALAPDGSWLVYTGPGSAPSETQLWVKARDRLEATPLAGTVGAHAPDVSPDGKWIAFVADNQVRKVPAAGGVATAIADSAGLAPVWLDDKTVAYADGRARVRRVAAAGGASEIVSAPEGAHLTLPLGGLPDGRGILFLDCSNNCTPTSDLWVADARSEKARRLLPDVAGAKFVDGRLVFVRRDGSVFAVPFDLGRLTLQGAPVALFTGVRVDNQAHFALATSGTLAYIAAGSGDTYEAVWVSREGRAVPVDTSWSFQLPVNSGWALSPDGTRLAIALTVAGNADIWIKQLDGGAPSRLTFSDSLEFRPGWTPDGRTVTFLSGRAGTYDLYARRADGTGADSLVLHLEAPIWEALYSRNGQWLVVRTGRLGGGANALDILALRVGHDTLPRPLLTPYEESAPALSPDGRWLAYVSTETGQREVLVRPFPNVEAGRWQISTGGGTSPVWAHSGRELFFINGNREMVSQAVLPGTTFRPGEQRVLFTIGSSYRLESFNHARFDISPDDRRFLMVRQKATGANGGSELIVVENWMEEMKRAMKGQ